MPLYTVTYLNPDNSVAQITMSDVVMQIGRDGIAVYVDPNGQPTSQPPYTMVFQPWGRILRITGENVGPPAGSG